MWSIHKVNLIVVCNCLIIAFVMTYSITTFSNLIRSSLYFVHNWIISKVYRKYSKILQVMNKTLRLPTARIKNLISYRLKISLRCLDFLHTSNIHKLFNLRLDEWLSRINKDHTAAFVKKCWLPLLHISSGKARNI